LPAGRTQRPARPRGLERGVKRLQGVVDAGATATRPRRTASGNEQARGDLDLGRSGIAPHFRRPVLARGGRAGPGVGPGRAGARASLASVSADAGPGTWRRSGSCPRTRQCRPFLEERAHRTPGCGRDPLEHLVAYWSIWPGTSTVTSSSRSRPDETPSETPLKGLETVSGIWPAEVQRLRLASSGNRKPVLEADLAAVEARVRA